MIRRRAASRRRPTSWRTGARSNIASNLTFASLPLTFMGGWINWFADQDRNPAFDLLDVKKDIAFIGQLGGEPVQWRWYQNGYDREPTDSSGAATHENYVSHHNGPQYFGYIANNPAEADQSARRRRLLRRHGEERAAAQRAACSTSAAATTISITRTDRDHPEPELPQQERPDRSRDCGHQRRQVRRRRSSELFRQPAQRGHGGARDQRHRRATRTSGSTARSSSPTTSPTASTITCRRGS